MLSLHERRSTVEAVVRLLPSADFQELMKWISESREDQRDRNEQASGNEIYRGCGQSMNMTELLDGLNECPKILERMKKAPEPQGF